MLNLPRFRELARQALNERNPVNLRRIVAEMESMLRAEQDDLKQLLAARRERYPGPPLEPGIH